MHHFFAIMLMIVSGTWLVWRVGTGQFLREINPPMPIILFSYIGLWLTAMIGYLVTK